MSTDVPYEVALRPAPARQNVLVGGARYVLRNYWVDADGGGWFLDLLRIDGTPLACGLPLAPGVDLLGQLGYLGVGPGAVLYCYTDGAAYLPPTYDNLGRGSHLVFRLGG